MKKLILTIVLFCFAGGIIAQSAKKQSSAANTSTTITSSETTMTCTTSNDNYSLTVIAFHSLPGSIKALLVQLIGQPQIDNPNMIEWSQGASYLVNLNTKRLTISVDKQIANAALIKLITGVGQKIQQLLNPSAVTASPE